MPSRPRQLPSLTALTSFEAAARHVGFKAAAGELNVTPAAISHQIKALEAELGVPLFLRNHRGVELTEAGALLFVAIQRGFAGIADAVAQVRLRSDQHTVTIESTTAVSALWLTPRLTRFWSDHGDVAVSQNVTDSPGAAMTSDLRIFYGRPGPDPDRCQLLFRDRIAVLAAPGFAERHGVTDLRDLVRVPLIHISADELTWTGWATFLDALGVQGTLRPAHHVNNYAIALQAAEDGNGAVLGWERLTRRLTASGALVRLVGDSIAAPYSFYIRTARGAHPGAALLRDWLLSDARSGA